MNKEIDLLKGSLPKGILRFAFPLAATGILQQLFNASDLAVVGHFVGSGAMAAVGTNGSLIWLIINLFMGISLGSTVVIATAFGAGDHGMIHKAVHTSILLAIVGGIVTAVFGELIARPALKLMRVPDEIFDMALLYLRIYLAGLPVIFLYNYEAAIFRSIGNTRTPLMALFFSGLFNVALNVFFVVVLKMDVDGVAWATVISNLLSSAFLLRALCRTRSEIKVSLRELAIDGGALKELLRIGIPSGLQGMVFSFSNIVLQSAVNTLGTIVIAGSTAALNIESFAYNILNSFGQACTTCVSQNHGAGNEARCRQSLKWCLVLDFLCTGTACTLILIFSHQILYLFNSDPEVIANATVRLHYIFIGYLFSFAQEVLSGYLRGYGQSTIPAVCAVAGICGVRIFWVVAVFPSHHTFSALMFVYPVSLAITTFIVIIATLIFERRKKQAV